MKITIVSCYYARMNDYDYNYDELNLDDWDDDYENYMDYLDWLSQCWD